MKLLEKCTSFGSLVILAIVGGACSSHVAPRTTPPPALVTQASPPGSDVVHRYLDPCPSCKIGPGSYQVVRTYFATDRNLAGGTEPAMSFGSERSGLSFGTCDVSIPGTHREGNLESPSFWRLEFREDRFDHVVLINVSVLPKTNFLNQLTSKVTTSPRRAALLFIHGYNVDFYDAARRTAQIAFDLKFDGAPVFYSWPSQGNFVSYLIDDQNAEWSQIHLKEFLNDFFEHSGADRIYLIAHSMGNRALTRALISLLAENPHYRDRLTEVILAAPDIDADVFKQEIAPAIVASGRPVTLYASSQDRALILSKQARGGYPRAGDSGNGLILFSGMETVDATNVDTSFLGHSYYSNDQLLEDISDLINKEQRADQRRTLQAVDSESGRYWTFKN